MNRPQASENPRWYDLAPFPIVQIGANGEVVLANEAFWQRSSFGMVLHDPSFRSAIFSALRQTRAVTTETLPEGLETRWTVLPDVKDQSAWVIGDPIHVAEEADRAGSRLAQSLAPGVLMMFYGRGPREGEVFWTSRPDSFALADGEVSRLCPAAPDREAFYVSIQESAMNLTAWHFEGDFVTPQGTRSVLFHGRTEPRSDPLRVVAYVQDLTSTTARLAGIRELADGIPGCLIDYETGPSGDYVCLHVTEGIRELIGVSPAQFRQSPGLLFESIEPRQFAGVMDRLTAAYQSGRGADIAFHVVRDGERKLLRLRSHPVVRSAGRVRWKTLLTEETPLPMAATAPPAPVPMPPPSSEDSPEVQPAPPAPQIRILLVEDHPVNLLLTTRMLEKLGCAVSTAANGLIAVKVCEQQAFDLVFMDLHMPVMDGIEATLTIRRREPEETRQKIVAMTAAAMQEDRDRCLEAGMDDYLSKPFTREQLVEVISRVTGKSMAA